MEMNMTHLVDQNNHSSGSVEAFAAPSAAILALRATAPLGGIVPRPRRPLAERLRSADRIVLTVAATVLILAMVVPAQAVESLLFVAGSFAHVAPWFTASVLLAAAAKASGADALAARVFAGREGWAIIAGALLGALDPFCSCGVIPVIAGFLAAGVPLGPVMAYWLASPLMDPAKFAVLAGTLGLEFALVQTAAAIGIGLLGGFGTAGLARAGVFDGALRDTSALRSSCCAKKRTLNLPAPVWRFWEEPERAQRFVVEASRTGWFLARWLTLAFLLESLMTAWLPGEVVARHLGASDAAHAIPVAVLLGVPAYLNGYAAVPLVKALVDLGMSPAVGLAFLIAGAVTSVPAAAAVWGLVRLRLFAAYLGFAAFGSLAAGYAYAAWLMAG
jgi:uncharacterized membrane protein YraQ (UPF0718 family)